LRRPGATLETLDGIARELGEPLPDWRRSPLTCEAARQIEVEIKYEGYLRRQATQVEQRRRLEQISLPLDLDYGAIPGISHESREKLTRVRPTTLAQASRIPGIRPTDIALIAGYLRRSRRLASTTSAE
jgi:tRNA uridine 5-carboxymethylaminomethyl modification enzyme